ncbi:GDYXXLXY domain-containing protein [Thermoflavimicrobium dichotomicum]|uniref:Uncharacterized membrane-anchored protein n=1 Tax=Thermoflavimicrobium dichotomicum TaxID=46223 RepID=A0A1I3S698_9BACL|nr:GDYXXLXY domain-containing protein [Thermoflavimicrobium dichotomicum]SFJ54225.1 Uncharacterized membrane-anchored protein [Thermoflavimicrobium dichotomicum]
MRTRILPNRYFFVTLLIPVVVLLSMTVKPMMATMYGQTIALQTVPYDPRDLFYGDYATLKYEISEVKASILDKELALKLKKDQYLKGVPVYVSLKKKGKVYTAEKVSEKKPTSPIYLEGKLYPGYNETSGEPTYLVHYPFEQFYVEEGTGPKLEEMSRKGKLIVYLKVKDGYAILTNIEMSP